MSEQAIDRMDEQARIASWKRAAGEAAAALVEDGMALGLGTGSTTYWAIEAIGRRLAQGELRDIVGVATSQASASQAAGLDIPLRTLSEQPRLDLAIDGADEIAPDLGLIKGGGAALVREKIVARVSDRFVVVGDESKMVERLGISFALPVAVVPFGWASAQRVLRDLGAEVTLRNDPHDTPLRTDDGLYVLDARFGDGIDDPLALEERLERDPAVVACGLFLDMAEQAMVGGEKGLQILRSTRNL